MISLGLDSAAQQRFHDTLHSNHSVDIIVRVLDKDRRYLADISNQLFDGQVNVDGDADVTRNLTLSLNDPDHALMWDTKAPSDGALFIDRMIQVIYVVTAPATSTRVPGNIVYGGGYGGGYTSSGTVTGSTVKVEPGESWSVPIFTGPITKVSRTVDVVNVEAQGMEQQIIPPTVAWFSKTYPKNTKRTDLVRRILTDLGGEAKFTFPDWPEKTTKDTVILFDANIWAAAKDVVGSRAVNHLFYDGRGTCVLRKTPTTPCFAFKTGEGGNITTQPQVNYSIDDVRNKVRVVGAIPKGKKTGVVGVATAPASHPLSPVSLGRNGHQRVMLEQVDDDTVKTTAAANQLAASKLAQVLLEAVDVTFDALVIPHLEPEDVYTINTPSLSLSARVKQFSIPLKEGTMSVGYNAKKSVNAARIRRK